MGNRVPIDTSSATNQSSQASGDTAGEMARIIDKYTGLIERDDIRRLTKTALRINADHWTMSIEDFNLFARLYCGLSPASPSPSETDTMSADETIPQNTIR